MKLLLVDNNDSFTYNIVELLRKIEYISFDIIINQDIRVEELVNYDFFIISPGPGLPDDFPNNRAVINYCYLQGKPLLGICLGHQTIAQFFGAKLIRLQHVVHGQKKEIKVDNTHKLFHQFKRTTKVGLYHSWAVNKETLPTCLLNIAESDDGMLMAVAHQTLPIVGVQFHPESFLTSEGLNIILNFIASTS